MQKLFYVFLAAFLFSFISNNAKGGYLQEIQSIYGNNINDIESFTIDGDTYLAFVNEYEVINGSNKFDIESKIYKWNGKSRKKCAIKSSNQKRTYVAKCF